MTEASNDAKVVEATPVNEESRTIRVRDGAPMIDLSTAEGVEIQAKRIEAYMAAQARIRKACINLLNCNDLIDQDGKPYLQWIGTSKIASAFGVSYDTPKFSQSIMSDEKGEYVNIQCESLIRYAGRSIPEIGSCSTRDEFFAKRKTWNEQKKEYEFYYLPLSEIDINDIKKKSLTNMLNRGLKSLLGMSFSWEEIAEATGGRITREKCVGVKHDKGKQGGSTDSPDTAGIRSEIRKMILEMVGGDEGVAKDYLKEKTTWKDKDGKTVPGKTNLDTVSEKQLSYLLKDVKKDYEEYSKNLNKAGK